MRRNLPNVVTGTKGPAERRRRDEIGEKYEHIRKTSVDAEKETGQRTGPFRLNGERRRRHL
ncbi:hypothetical protein LCGC14_2640260 [marine sediment metagenome]|uniref:Uncharacterized protein n=1 Tax=marine sediment metagenome TaxID=412755 RepID=A0A0F9AK51_9ZZZZ